MASSILKGLVTNDGIACLRKGNRRRRLASVEYGLLQGVFASRKLNKGHA